MTNIQASIGCAQINKIQEIISLKNKVYNQYLYLLKEKVKFFKKLDKTNPSFWMTPIIFKSKTQKQKVYLELKRNNIETRPFFTPIDKLPFYEESDCRIANKNFERGLLLPSFPGLSLESQNQICNIIINII